MRVTFDRGVNLLYILVRFIFEFPLIWSSVDKICWERIVTNLYNCYNVRVSFSHLKGLLACFRHIYGICYYANAVQYLVQNTTLSSALVRSGMFRQGYIKKRIYKKDNQPFK